MFKFVISPKCSLFPFVFSLLLVNCSFFKPAVKDGTESAPVDPKQKQILSDMAAELDIGRNMAGRLLNFYGMLDDPDLVKYVNEVGSFVGSVSDHPERHYMFALLDTEAVNAFACPGGYIMVTLGSLRHAENEAELAAILGHEVAHVGERHMFNTLIHLQGGEKDSRDVAKDARPESLKVRDRPSPDDDKSATGDMLARYLSGATSASAGLLKAAKEGMFVILEKGLDKNLEYQADDLGTRYAIRAGYKPDALYQFIARLDQVKKKQHLDTSVLDRTHPKLSDRKKKIADLLVQLDAKKMVGASVDDRFKKYYQSLPEEVKQQQK